MICEETMLKVVDNTGAKIIQCFRILGGTKRKYARIGDIIIASVKKAEPRRLVKKHEIVKAIIVRQKKEYKRKDGSYVRFDENAAVIIDEKKEPRGNRIFGPIPREIEEKGFVKISSLASDII
jgi:large subunit ribosomal protein L14